MNIRKVQAEDSCSMAEIYNYYIEHSVITFEEELIDSDSMDQRIENINKLNLPWIVAEDGQNIVGYAYAASWRVRSAYRYAVEVGVYLKPECQGQGWGTELLTKLLIELKQGGIHVAIGCITLPNDASIALHEKLGMKKVGVFEKVGIKFGQWLDVGFWQKDLRE